MNTAPLSFARALALALGALALPFTANAQDWIWLGKNAGEKEVAFFRKSFRLGETPGKALLSVACDNQATIYLDGKVVGENESWSEPTVIDLSKLLKAGDHLLGVWAENHGGQAGLLAKLEVV